MKKLLVIGGAVVALYAASQHPAAAAAPHGASMPVLVRATGGTLSCSGLEALWEAEGGSRSEAFMAAEIAMAESSGHEYATDLNGGASTDRGYWQINSVHGSLSTYNPAGNARAAIQLSDDGTDWTPWVTFNTGAYRSQC